MLLLKRLLLKGGLRGELRGGQSVQRLLVASKQPRVLFVTFVKATSQTDKDAERLLDLWGCWLRSHIVPIHYFSWRWRQRSR